MSYDKEKLQYLIWQNPSAVFPKGVNFTPHGAEQWARERPDGTESNSRRPNKTVLKQQNGQVFVFYNGTSAGFLGGDIWDYLKWLHNTNEFLDVLQIAAEAYGVEPDYSGYSEERIKKAKQRRADAELLKIAAAYITDAINKPEGQAAKDYAEGRGLHVTERLGAYSGDIRSGLKARLQQCGATAKHAEELLQQWFPVYADDYKLAAPFTNGSNRIIGFALRRTTDDIYYIDRQSGKENEKPKYIYSNGMERGCGYCGNLKGGISENVYIVEGILDAEAMKQYGYSNVLALGGIAPKDNEAEPNKSAIRTLLRYNAKKLYYIPDCEYYDAEDEAKGKGTAGQRKEKATHDTIKALLPHITNNTDGRGFAVVRIVDIQTAEGLQRHEKEDADGILRKHGQAYLQQCIANAKQWYEYELQQTVKEYSADAAIMTTKATEIYRRISNYAQRNMLKADITDAKSGYMLTLKEAGLTAQALSYVDRDDAAKTWAARMAEITAAIPNAKTPESMGALLNKAQRIQNAETFNDFAAQINITREELHRLISSKPDYLNTTWKLYKQNKKNIHYSNRVIGFAPAAVSICAAPTNHGKTLFLLQTAINCVLQEGKHIIYASLENDNEQLYVRALAAYMGMNGEKIQPDEYGNIPNLRDAIRTGIKGDDMPPALFSVGNKPLDIAAYEDEYEKKIAPLLGLARVKSDVDAMINNMTEQVEQWRNAGTDAVAIFVDYLQLLHAPNLYTHSRTDEVKYICDRLNDMAKQTKLPVILAAQFNRAATQSGGDGLDGVELANIGESAGIENIAEDVYLIWQVDKIKVDALPHSKDKTEPHKLILPPSATRTRRCFEDIENDTTLRDGYLYIENLKARDYATGGYCLLPFYGAAGAVTSKESTY